jgi:hypothetical protein
MDRPARHSRLGIGLMAVGAPLLVWGSARPTCPSLGFSVLNAGTVLDCGGPDPFLMWLVYTVVGGAMFFAGLALVLRAARVRTTWR